MNNKAAWDLDPSYIHWAPTKKHNSWIAHKSAPSAPPAPDYAAAAQQTAAGNMENLKYQTQANRATQVTPWGTLSWSQGKNADGTDNNQWTQNIALSADQQKALSDQMSIQSSQSQLAHGLQGQVADTMAGGFNAPSLSDYTKGVGQVNQNFSGFDTNGMPQVNTNAPQFSTADAQAGAKAAYEAQMGLLQPQMEQDTTHLDNQLRLQGLTPGTEAYNNAAQNLQRTQDQTKTQAANQAVLTGNQEANQNYASSLAGYGAQNQAVGQNYSQALAGYGANVGAQQSSNAAVGQANAQGLQNYSTAYSSALQNYLQPLNSMNAVLTGQQVQSPSFSNYNQAGYTAGPDMTGAASSLGQYNSGVYAQQVANVGSQNALLGSALGAAGSYFAPGAAKK